MLSFNSINKDSELKVMMVHITNSRMCICSNVSFFNCPLYPYFCVWDIFFIFFNFPLYPYSCVWDFFFYIKYKRLT